MWNIPRDENMNITLIQNTCSGAIELATQKHMINTEHKLWVKLR